MSSERKEYWNRSYLEYWKSRVDEAAPGGQPSAVIAGDAATEDDAVYEAVFREHPPRAGSVLDVGCAWGRMFGVFKRMGLKITGVDISQAMIEQARVNWSGDADVVELRECEAEGIPFADGQFDNVACLAVFDATYQDQALAQYLRVLRTDGLLFLTGKNDFYPDDDTLAMQAEIGARGKGHPNYFTDTASMLAQLKAQGQAVLATYFFARRGDFGAFKFTREMPERYYEYFVVVQKKAQPQPFMPFSDSRSRTFRERQP